MSTALGPLLDALRGSPLAERAEETLAPLAEAPGAAERLRGCSEPVRRGIARAAAAQPETAGFLSRHPRLLERLVRADSRTLAARAAELEDAIPPGDTEDLEAALDALRVLRREDTCLAACLQLGELVPFSTVSIFLSRLAEAICAGALALARHERLGERGFAVLGMGKIAGREFTYHSDLDLIFLSEAGPESIHEASRVGQRLLAYLTTMTGAGIAYAVDTRLRPSGRQGMLVTSLAGFESYQCDHAETWEHVAMLRSRPIAGSLAEATDTLARVREQVRAGHPPPWDHLAGVRERVERERDPDSPGIAFKTAAGGLMDVDFLAGGALLERHHAALPETPAVPTLLRAAVAGPRVEELLEGYALLREVEAVARWIAGRPVEQLADDAAALDRTAELVEPGLPGAELAARVEGARKRIRSAYDDVLTEGSIAALEA